MILPPAQFSLVSVSTWLCVCVFHSQILRIVCDGTRAVQKSKSEKLKMECNMKSLACGSKVVIPLPSISISLLWRSLIEILTFFCRARSQFARLKRNDSERKRKRNVLLWLNADILDDAPTRSHGEWHDRGRRTTKEEKEEEEKL